MQAWGFSKVKAVVPGGKERYHSVYEGLKALFPVFKPEPSGCVHPVFTPGLSGCVRPVSKPGASGFVFSGGDEDGLWHDDAAFLKGGEDEEWYVLIHDGARPLVSEAVIQRAIEGAVKYRACVVVVRPQPRHPQRAGPHGRLWTAEQLPRYDHRFQELFILYPPRLFQKGSLRLDGGAGSPAGYAEIPGAFRSTAL